MLKVRKNLRKVVAIAICLAGSATMFAQETGVVINGVTWATRNVGAPGTFSAAPESSGMFYQWNSKIGWSSTDPLVSTNGSTWNSSWNGNGATSWEAANNPCPSGWLVPTEADFEKLLDATKVNHVLTTLNGVNGYRFTDIATGNSIFLSFAGFRNNNNGSLNGGWCCYWNGMTTNNNCLYFDGGGVALSTASIAYGFPIRPVKDGSTGINDVSADTENAKVTGYFDILGRKLTEEPTKGIYIIQYDNGRTKKIMK